MEPEVLLLCSL